MGDPPAPSRVRLAEVVAALSLGIDLGFGQPMEHVLRQCLIATRLADRVGLDDLDRAGVYYTSLLINVGCHTDAHEQAKWFGNDIDLKSDKYAYEPKTFREMRGRPPAVRFRPSSVAAGQDGRRVRAARAARPRGDDQPPRHVGPDARAGARASGGGVRRARWGLRAVGRQGLAGHAGGRGGPDRIAHRAARRVRRGRPPGARDRRRLRLADRRAGAQFDPALAKLLRAGAGGDLRRPRRWWGSGPR